MNDGGAPAARLAALLAELGWSVGIAESLTGGLVTDAVVSVPGASRVLRGGVTAYTPAIKTAVLGVPSAVIAEHGVVSAPVARAMARGAADLFGSDVALATTGVAGPGPSDGVACGTVVVAALVRWSGRELVSVRTLELAGTRPVLRAAARDLVLGLGCGLLQQVVAVRGVGNKDAGHGVATSDETTAG